MCRSVPARSYRFPPAATSVSGAHLYGTVDQPWLAYFCITNIDPGRIFVIR